MNLNLHVRLMKAALSPADIDLILHVDELPTLISKKIFFLGPFKQKDFRIGGRV